MRTVWFLVGLCVIVLLGDIRGHAVAQIVTDVPTPGVYIEEVYPERRVSPVATAIPVFIGYTERQPTPDNGGNTPHLITSVADYESTFGGAPMPWVELVATDPANVAPSYASINGTSFQVRYATGGRGFLLHKAIRHYFANGGAEAYIISVGTFDGPPPGKPALAAGLYLAETLNNPGPTLLLMPDALLLPVGDYYDLANAMLAQAEQLGDRFAIIDVYRGDEDAFAPTVSSPDPISEHRARLGTVGRRNGASYYPFLNTSLIEARSITPDMINDSGDGLPLSDLVGPIPSCGTIEDAPGFDTIQTAIARHLSVMPPGPALAGLYAKTDTDSGVWKAPANTDVIGAFGPVVNVDSANQSGMNIDPTTGISVNAIRAFSNQRNAVVWGARTLDSNAVDNRYVSQRRLQIFIEESLRLYLRQQAFEENNAANWSAIKISVETFMGELWRDGALAGSTPDDAFSVQIGLGTTMTAQDIAGGILRMDVLYAAARPAEYTILQFEQAVAE